MQFQYLDQPSMGFSSILQKIINLMNLTAKSLKNVVCVQTLIFINALLDM